MYDDDLTIEDIIDIFIGKGVLTEEDIDDYIINESEDLIYLRNLEEQEKFEREKARKEAEEKLNQEKMLEREERLKKVYPHSDKIIRDMEIYNLMSFGSLLWVLDYGILLFLGVGLWSWLPLLGWLIFMWKSNTIKPLDYEHELAKESKIWIKEKELAKILSSNNEGVRE